VIRDYRDLNRSNFIHVHKGKQPSISEYKARFPP